MSPKTPLSDRYLPAQAKKPKSPRQQAGWSKTKKYTVIRDGKKYSLTEEQYQKWLAYLNASPHQVTIGGKNFNLSDKELERYIKDIETKGRKETHKTWLQQQLDRSVDQKLKIFQEQNFGPKPTSLLIKKGGLIKKSKVKKKNKKKAPIKKRRTRRKKKA